MNTYINDTREWLLNMGYVDPFSTDGTPEEKAEKTGELFRRFDAGELTGEEVEFLGIAQNLRQMTHSGISADKYGRLQSECSNLKRSVEMRRDVMPSAISGAAVIAGSKLGRKNRDQNNKGEKELWRNTAKSILAGRKKKPGQRELARSVAKQIHPLLTDDEIGKLADSRRRWIADLL